MAEYEQERVMCEECGEQEACCTVAVMMGGQAIHRRLCQACMAKASMSIAAGNIGKVLGAIMAAAHKAAGESVQEAARTEAPEETETPEAPGEEVSCPRCGKLQSEFRKSGRLGCAACYGVFRDQIMPILEKNCPLPEHTGRRPLSTEAAKRSRARREELQRRMEEAVARDDFETAAKLRDKLRSLTDTEVCG